MALSRSRHQSATKAGSPTPSDKTLTSVPTDDINTNSQPDLKSSPNTATDIEQPAIPPTETAQDQPPDGGYGWVCVACVFWINACTWGINSTYAVFLAYYLSHDYFPNTSALAYAFIGGTSISTAVFIAPLATLCVSKLGTRATLHIGIFFETLSLITASFAHKKYEIVCAQGLCFGVGMGFLFVASVAVVPQWFSRRRSFANSITAAGSGCGGLIWSLATQKMIDSIGLPWAFRILGIVSGVVNLVAANLIRDRNKAVGSRIKSFDWAMLKRGEFWLVQGWSWFSMFGYVVVLFSLPSYAREIGLTAGQGAVVGAVFNLGQMVGRPFIGLSSDKGGRINCALLYSVLEGMFTFVFWIPTEVVAGKYALLLFFSLVGGALAGTFWATVAPVEAEVVGIQDLPAALSWTWVIMVPPVTCAEPIALVIRKTQPGRFVYIYAQLFCGLAYIMGGLCLWVLRGWKVGELEELERFRRKEEIMRESLEGEKASMTRTDTRPDLTRQISAISAKQEGWRLKPLMRRMVKWKVV